MIRPGFDLTAGIWPPVIRLVRGCEQMPHPPTWKMTMEGKLPGVPESSGENIYDFWLRELTVLQVCATGLIMSGFSFAARLCNKSSASGRHANFSLMFMGYRLNIEIIHYFPVSLQQIPGSVARFLEYP